MVSSALWANISFLGSRPMFFSGCVSALAGPSKCREQKQREQAQQSHKRRNTETSCVRFAKCVFFGIRLFNLEYTEDTCTHTEYDNDIEYRRGRGVFQLTIALAISGQVRTVVRRAHAKAASWFFTYGLALKSDAW